MKVTVSAPGKIHLSGEHAVVYRKPALVVSTSKRLYVTIEKIKDQKSKIKNSSNETRKKDVYIDTILKIVEKEYNISVQDVFITITSDIPVGAGMGSSAATAVSLIGALITYFNKPWDIQRINELAYQAEKAKHGNPSGSDPTIVTHGGVLWFRKELEVLKTFWLLPFKIPKTFAPFVLINTGRTEPASELIVEVIGTKKKENKDAFELLLAKIEHTTRTMAQAIHDEDEGGFKKMIRENERYLEELGVVSTLTKQLIKDVENSGGVAKISGAGGVKGGSGIVIAVHTDPQQVIQLAEKYHFPSFQVQLGGEGVKKEQITV